MTHTAVISNYKGGVGKSQLVVQLAAALARAGKRILVVDLDSQGNATRRLGVTWDPANPILSMSEVIKADAVGAGEEAVVPAGWTGPDGAPTMEAMAIDVLPARVDLVNRDTEAGVTGAVRRVKKALEGWTSGYDVVLIDTPPGLGHLVQMAMAAADTVIIPTDPAFDGVQAAVRVNDFIAQHALDIYNPDLTVGGVVVSRRDGQALEHSFQVEGLREIFGDLVWKIGGLITTSNGSEFNIPLGIPEWKRYAEADAAAVSLTAWSDKRGRETVAIYDVLARIFIDTFLTSKEKAA